MILISNFKYKYTSRWILNVDGKYGECLLEESDVAGYTNFKSIFKHMHTGVYGHISPLYIHE